MTFSIHNIDQVTDEVIIATLQGKAIIEAYCSYHDYENVAWDSEEKKYVYLDQVELLETHAARFAIRIEIVKGSEELKVSTGLVLLGRSTLKNTVDIGELEYLQDIEDTDREG